MMKVELPVNGVSRTADVEPRKTLLDALRENFLLNGAHAGCEHGVCGACTVLVDGEPVRSCLMFAVQADGYEITTIEGLAPAPGELSVIQDAFCETHGLQCGYCTPAMILTAHALLQQNEQPSREEIVEAISGNLCRCTGYGQIIEAVQFAAERLRKANTPRPHHVTHPAHGEHDAPVEGVLEAAEADEAAEGMKGAPILQPSVLSLPIAASGRTAVLSRPTVASSRMWRWKACC